MIVSFHRDFKKRYKKLRDAEKQKFRERISVFMKDRSDPVLNNHPLHGKYAGYWSINVTGDLRALYKLAGSEKCMFVKIDTHAKLYSR
ncbi:MAG: hypothetical protein A2946_01665 [Candidatus Liptonbacteria bacterium RIFCSPLOWO2_01_FULL_53_13]|uniref:Type II toxin-antitoxin system mRNA interferase toxin, RelE/StbE family n=1 Tax=Candidatus Liptonbacteria bacterium RIFCSPLOWO2_01_FULL_53_13 TaxID=1798651 RepID=A0A1G2CN01_9BACT|nr:MAG: hypothetical protein A2946_01665 [Candidatus Liptonbacteria bacterium RIFCSPLOWO2_01_FULL_53_13]